MGQGSSGRDSGNCCINPGNKLIAKYTFEGNMKDGAISKLLINKTGHRLTQYKKIVDYLLVLCADKNYQGLDDVIWNRIDQVKTDNMPTYPDVIEFIIVVVVAVIYFIVVVLNSSGIIL